MKLIELKPYFLRRKPNLKVTIFASQMISKIITRQEYSERKPDLSELGLKQDFDRLEENLSIQFEQIYSLSSENKKYSEQNYRELKHDLNEQFERFQEISQALQTSAPDNEPRLNQLTCDLLKMVLNSSINERDKIVLISDDGDFKPVLTMVKEQGISIELIACNPSRYLIPLVDKIIYLDKI